MIRKWIGIVISCMYLIGCSQRIPLEQASLILLIALDRTPNGEIQVGTSIPLFHHEKQKSTVEHWVQASTIYEGFSKMDTKLIGFVTSSKSEVILIGKKFAQEENWIQALDSSYRDPYATINAKVVIVDGSPKSILKIHRPDKPALSSYISGVIEASIQNNQSVSSTIQQLMREKNEKGMTQTVPIIKKINNEIDTVGIAFLDPKGKYLTKISKNDVKFFNLINKSKSKGRIILHVVLSPKKSIQKPNTSVLVQDAKRKINVDFQKGKFIFNINMSMNVSLIEKTNGNITKNRLYSSKHINKLEHEIQEEINEKLQSMLQDMQRNKIDPIGLSVYARAFQYKEWKKVKEDWLQTLSKAKICVNTQVKIKDTGTIRN
ncbi:Ger(x)C family spore germination protein [Bacillus thuringiensis]|uniref:Ger(X)C family spore germination protein n=4 Tax=Bacillus thuringiensis TaxID=1428 RepID=A0AB35PK25_BACTU|nr:MULTISPECIES: Ger(x)C family spore germination protein [Bacillus]MED1157787.1 Ger(x)C family spore germination protein [Bacillus paranthracis]AFQ30474.1 putative spore germination protein [Bacillus thuringiensis HD-789]AND28700.1 spore gernimation protein XA [Bacillus thuringiensis serovar israelensis]ASO64528.1 putative spore germination protein [Bacillus thuringiensis serovar israelensis]KAA8479141.1 Ger(x)C family spore germination protein [Bacillus thuringiensis]